MDRSRAGGDPALWRRIRWGNLGRLAVLLAAGTLLAVDDLGRGGSAEEAPPPRATRPDARRPDARRPDARRPDVRRPDVRRPDARRPDARRPVAQPAETHHPRRRTSPRRHPARRTRPKRSIHRRARQQRRPTDVHVETRVVIPSPPPPKVVTLP